MSVLEVILIDIHILHTNIFETMLDRIDKIHILDTVGTNYLATMLV